MIKKFQSNIKRYSRKFWLCYLWSKRWNWINRDGKKADISNEPFDFILMDWNMPRLNGKEAIKKFMNCIIKRD